MNIGLGGIGGYGSKFLSKDQLSKGGKNANKIHSERMKNDIDYFNMIIKVRSNNFKKAHKEGKINYNTFEGRNHSDETKNKISESKKGQGSGNTNSQYGTCWITKEGENKKIKKEDLDTYLVEGWIKGRN